MSPTMKYLVITLKHKWFVFIAGRKLKVPFWRLVVHDWSKLLPHNLTAYGEQFFGKQRDSLGFAYTWMRHQNTHEHHWEYWIPRTGHNRSIPPYPDNKPLPMTKVAMHEMVADWMGASRAYEGRWPTERNWIWYQKNFPKIKKRLNKATAIYIEYLVLENIMNYDSTDS